MQQLFSCLGVTPNKTNPDPPLRTVAALGTEERQSVRLPSSAIPSSPASSATESAAETASKAETAAMKRQLQMQAEYMTMVGAQLAKLATLLEQQAKEPRAGDKSGSVVSKKKKATRLCGGICALLAIVALITAAVAGGNMALRQPHTATLLQPTTDSLKQPTDNLAAAEALAAEAPEDNSSGTPAVDQPQPHSKLAADSPPQPQSAVPGSEAEGGGGGKAQALPRLVQFANVEGEVSQVEAWLDGGGDVDVRDEDGATLLMSAAFHRREPNVQMLLGRGAAVNLQTPAGLSALMAATLNGDAAIVRRLLEAGGVTRLRSGYDETALQIAKRKGFADCARLLQSHEPPSGGGP